METRTNENDRRMKEILDYSEIQIKSEEAGLNRFHELVSEVLGLQNQNTEKRRINEP